MKLKMYLIIQKKYDISIKNYIIVFTCVKTAVIGLNQV